MDLWILRVAHSSILPVAQSFLYLTREDCIGILHR